MDAVIELGYDTGKADKFIKGLDEIKDCEYLYQHYINSEVNGKKKALINFAAYGDFKLYTGISGLGEEPEADEVYICEGYAGQPGVKLGDTVEIKDLDSYSTDENGTEEHSTYKFKVKGLCSTLYYYNTSFVVNKKWFRDNLNDYVDNIYINLRSPEDIDKVTSEVERQFRSAVVEARENVVRNSDENSRSIQNGHLQYDKHRLNTGAARSGIKCDNRI